MRDQQDKILLLGLYSTKHAKPLGSTCRMLCGIHQSTGKVYVEPCLRDDLLKIQAGVGPFLISDDKHGGTMAIILEAHFLGFSADLLGAHGLGPWPESFQARHACLDCWWNSRCFCAYLPIGSPELSAGKAQHSEGCRGRMELRTQQGFQQDIIRLQSERFTSQKKREDALRAAGVNQ
mmetsp:Transcript_34198/g.77495  ORF Transcript_34198/g.77495 Transcript_34198/m.77495 type:complete len:178 (-) Transcript_34198:28-561(-)